MQLEIYVYIYIHIQIYVLLMDSFTAYKSIYLSFRFCKSHRTLTIVNIIINYVTEYVNYYTNNTHMKILN